MNIKRIKKVAALSAEREKLIGIADRPADLDRHSFRGVSIDFSFTELCEGAEENKILRDFMASPWGKNFIDETTYKLHRAMLVAIGDLGDEMKRHGADEVGQFEPRPYSKFYYLGRKKRAAKKAVPAQSVRTGKSHPCLVASIIFIVVLLLGVFLCW